MSYPIVRIDPTTAGRERSPALWGRVLENYSADRSLGVLRSDDFTEPHATAGAGALSTNGRWWMAEEGTTGATSETFDTTLHPNGEGDLVGTTGADFIGVQAIAGCSATQSEGIVLPTATSDSKAGVTFESRCYLDITLNPTLFIGLGEIGSTILTGTNVLTSAADYIGFYRLDASNLLFVSHNDTTGESTSQIIKTAAQMSASYDAAYVKTGFSVDANNKVTVTIDGVKIKVDSSGDAITVVSTALPVEKLSRKFGACRGATADNATVAVKCDWIECYVGE